MIESDKSAFNGTSLFSPSSSSPNHSTHECVCVFEWVCVLFLHFTFTFDDENRKIKPFQLGVEFVVFFYLVSNHRTACLAI